jgi:hypothetical protein
MLEDETTWFLAVDFDKTSWKEDVASFAETGHSHGIPAAIERSRSGNGAHAWFFFRNSQPGGKSGRRGEQHHLGAMQQCYAATAIGNTAY